MRSHHGRSVVTQYPVLVPLPGGPVTNTSNLPQENGLRRRVSGLPQFVSMRGGAYFFMPGIRALRYLASFGA